ncbi:MAG: hypothetical protein R6U29_02350 [Desulfosudaceae bacterium]
MIRLGLCCIFKAQPIRFRRTTARYLAGLTVEAQRRRLSEICLSNAENLMLALRFCHENGIGDFRISSPRNGWQAADIRKHHDYIDVRDMPDSWPAMDLTVEVEAKAKELAVLKLKEELARRQAKKR